MAKKTKKRRVTRKELLKKPDEFLTLSARMLQFALGHRTQVTWSVAALLCVLLVSAAVGYLINMAEGKASQMLNQSMAKYADSLKVDGPVEAASDVENDFEAILDKYSSRDAARFARLIYADICFNAGLLERAVDLYQAALEDFGTMQPYRNLILTSLGIAYEENQDYDAAVQHFERIIGSGEALMKDEALFALGRLYAALEQTDRSREAYSQLIEEYPGSFQAEIARDKTAS